jgi:hypothetical protein
MVVQSYTIINKGSQEVSGKLQHDVNCYLGDMMLLNKHCNLKRKIFF